MSGPGRPWGECRRARHDRPRSPGSARQVWLFPGHGAQYPGMGLALAAREPLARRWLERAEQACGQPLRRLLERGPAAALAAPSLLEPALAAVSCGWVDALRARGARPDAVAGYSAGELPALYAAGVLDADTVLRAATARGRHLAALAEARPGGMLAVNGLEHTALARLLDPLAAVWPAGWHAARSATLAGSTLALAQAGKRLRAAGAQVTHLPVAGPWHCPLALPASTALHRALAGVRPQEPHCEVWLASFGERCDDPQLLLGALADSVSRPVRWLRLVTGLLAAGSTHFTELGPGGTLCALLGLHEAAAGPAARGGWTRRALERAGPERKPPAAPARGDHQERTR